MNQIARIIICSMLLSLCAMLIFSCTKVEEDTSETGIFWPAEKKVYHAINNAIANQSLVTWSTGEHTTGMVPLGAVGPSRYTSRLSGITQNTSMKDVFRDAIADGVNVILVIGDGMSVSHLTLPVYMNRCLGKEQTAFEQITSSGVTGLCISTTYAHLQTDSAAAATAIATGHKTWVGMLGMNYRGEKVKSILDFAHSRGNPTGLITDTMITEATPAAFYTNVEDRNSHAEIARQLAREYNITVLMGGGARYFIPAGTRVKEFRQFQAMSDSFDAPSGRSDKNDLLTAFEKKGYHVVSHESQLADLKGKRQKILGLFSGKHMNSAIDRDDETTGEPSIPMMTETAISVLQRHGKGFFLMVECGKLDEDGHFNDIGAVLKALYEMDDVLKGCYQFYQKNPSRTLLVFTADHGTGGVDISYTKGTGKSPSATLESGYKWSVDKQLLEKKEFTKLMKQSKSYERILSGAGNWEEFRESFNTSTPYTLDTRDARHIFSLYERIHSVRTNGNY